MFRIVSIFDDPKNRERKENSNKTCSANTCDSVCARVIAFSAWFDELYVSSQTSTSKKQLCKVLSNVLHEPKIRLSLDFVSLPWHNAVIQNVKLHSHE